MSLLTHYRHNPWVQLLKGMEEASQDVSSWLPSVDIHAEKDRYVLRMELPGVDPKDIQISAEGNTLTIKGQKSEEACCENKSKHREECVYGQFFRQFTLPERVNTSDIMAKFKHGVLTVTLLKLPQHVEKSIQIHVE